MSRGETGWPSLGFSHESLEARLDAYKSLGVPQFQAAPMPKRATQPRRPKFIAPDRLMTLPFASVFKQTPPGTKPVWTADITPIIETEALGARTKRIMGALRSEAVRDSSALGTFFSFATAPENGRLAAPDGLLAEKLGTFGNYMDAVGLEIADIGPETRDRVVDLAGRLAVKFETERPALRPIEL